MQIRDQQLDNPNKDESLSAGYKLFFRHAKTQKIKQKKTQKTQH